MMTEKKMPTIRSELVLTGEKAFDQYGKKIQFLIVNHESFHCIEFIIIGTTRGNIAERKYFDSLVLLSKIDREQMRTTFEIKQDASKRRGWKFDADLEVWGIALNMISAMLIERLQIFPSVYVEEFDFAFGQFENFDSKMITKNTCPDFEFDQYPLGLLPYDVTHKSFETKRSISVF